MLRASRMGGRAGRRQGASPGKAAMPRSNQPKELSRSWPREIGIGLEPLEPRLLLSALPGNGAHSGGLLAPNYIICNPLSGTLYFPSDAPGDHSGGFRPLGSSAPVGLIPSQIRSAYGIDSIFSGTTPGDGTGQTIVIVDAYDNPSFVSSTDPGFAASDLHKFDLQFGLPDPPSFLKLDQNGGTNYPDPDPDWGTEIALDVEWAHAMAPKANIVLIEADSAWDSDLLSIAVDTARRLAGASVVSMSFGRDEDSGDTSLNSLFTTPSGHTGVTFVASTGDGGSPGGFPAYSPNVVAVGGTTLTLSGGAYLNETAWSGSGGGQSAYQTEPAYQIGVQVSGKRQIPDVAFDANPTSGVAVYDSYGSGSSSPWIQVGGTSLSAPCWAGLIAIADQFRVKGGQTPMDSISQTLPILYRLAASNYHDITTGGNGGYHAGPGYDMVTGLGSPAANLLVPSVAAGLNMAVVSSTPPLNSTLSTKPIDFVVVFSDAYRTSSVSAGDLLVNGLPAMTFTLTNSTTITFHFATSPITVQGAQTMSIAAGAILRNTDGRGNVAWNTSFRYDTLAIAVSGTAPISGNTVSIPLMNLRIAFNENVGTSSIGIGNLQLSQGTVTGTSLVNAKTVDYALAGITTEGTLTFTLPAGAVTDSYGNPGATYTGTLNLDIATAAYGAPLDTAAPKGSLVYDGDPGVVAYIGSSTDTDSYTIPLNAGQTLTALVVPAVILRPSVAVDNPIGGVLATASATAAGKDILVETVSAATTGTYTVVVSSLGSTSGQYTLRLTVNAALEQESYGGAANGTRGTAQNIDGSFVSLGTGITRGGVLGAADSAAGVLSSETEPNDATTQADQAYANFVSSSYGFYQMGIRGSISSGTDMDWFKIGAMDGGDLLTISESGSSSSRGTLGDPMLSLYRYNSGLPLEVASDDDGGADMDSLIYRYQIDTADTYYVVAKAYSGSTGTYDLGLWLDNADAPPGTGGTFTAETEYNNAFSTANNASTSWRKVQYVSQTRAAIDPDTDADCYAFQFTSGDLVSTDIVSNSSLYPMSALLTSTGLPLAVENGTSVDTGSTSPIYAYRIPTTGTYCLEVSSAHDRGSYVASVYLSTATAPPVPATNQDYYSFSLSAGDSVSLALTGLSFGTIHLGLENTAGTTLAVGAAGPTNLTEEISSFTAPTTGTYYARVSGFQSVPYSLTIVRNALLAAEPNGSMGAAQQIPLGPGIGSKTVVGHVDGPPTGVEPDDYYSGTVLTRVAPGITLSAIGGAGPVVANNSVHSSTGDMVFGNGTDYYWSDSLLLRADFSSPVSSVSLDLVPDDPFDPGFLKAYDSSGNLLQDVETGQPSYPGFLTMTVTRPTADIAYIVAGGQSGQLVLLDHLVVSGGAGGSDYYSLSGQAGRAAHAHDDNARGRVQRHRQLPGSQGRAVRSQRQAGGLRRQPRRRRPQRPPHLYPAGDRDIYRSGSWRGGGRRLHASRDALPRRRRPVRLLQQFGVGWQRPRRQCRR